MGRDRVGCLFAVFVICAVVLVECILVGREVRDFKLGYTKEPVSANAIENMYSVVVVTRSENGKYTASLECYDMLDDIKNSGKYYSFTISKATENELRRQIEKKSQPSRTFGPSTFKVERHLDGTQSITTFDTWHGGLNCQAQWYTATSHRITPRYYADLRLMKALASTLPVVSLLSVMVWIVGKAIFGRIRIKLRS